jgi:transposase
MQEARTIKLLKRKYIALKNDLDERARRRWAATEALALGRGGITMVSKATNIHRNTIAAGVKELSDPNAPTDDRQRREGGGRRTLVMNQPALMHALDQLLDPVTRGAPNSILRWTCSSTYQLATALQQQGFEVSPTSVRRLLRELGYSLQSNRKTREGKQHPDRDSQFQFIMRRGAANKRAKNPVLSIDTKKKENIGNFKNSGRTYQRRGEPIEVNMHDFPDPTKGKAIPYGVYEIDENIGFVSVGITHDTAEFAVESIRQWWKQLGKKRYRDCRQIMITADSGGSNSIRCRLWKMELQKLANELDKVIEVCHFPPGTSKWNKIEHRLFCHISHTWRGIPLSSLDIIVESIARTETATGLEVHVWVDEEKYETGKKVADEELAKCIIKKNRFHGEWNYEVHPQSL